MPPLQDSPLLSHLVCGDLHHGLDPLQPLGLQLLLHLFGVTAEKQASGRSFLPPGTSWKVRVRSRREGRPYVSKVSLRVFRSAACFSLASSIILVIC